jgi:hypothetical protein
MLPSPPPAAPVPPHFWLGTWGRPPDHPSQVALAAALGLLVVALVPGGPRWLAATLEAIGVADLRRSRRFLFVASFVAAFLSLGYVAFYLRGGPRAPDAATYWLQGRAMAHGHLAWTVPDPIASFRARSLLLAAPDRLAGILAPGYAALLGAAFLLGAPMLIGPLLAAALVPATWFLARELATGALARRDAPATGGSSAPVDERDIEAIGRIAVGMSLVSAALRYHTAESLPGGAAAAALTVALASALRARRTDDGRLFGVAGLALGFLIATEPRSAVGVGTIVLMLAFTSAAERAVAWTCGAAVPGIALLLAANHAATGHAFASPIAYYLARFGPAGGAPTGISAELMGTLRSVRGNLTDVANFEPIALLPLLLLTGAARRPRDGRPGGPGLDGQPSPPRLDGSGEPRPSSDVWMAFAVVVIQLFVATPAVAGEALTPGSGANLAAVLPVEHALVALALGLAFSRAWLAPAALATLALAVAGFALHTSHDHELVAAAGLGHPHYEPDVAREGGATHGLLYFDDDEGFELAHDPGVLASHGLLAVRMRGDDHDRALYDLLGHPQAHRYTAAAGRVATVSPWNSGGGDTWRFEAEADFPPVGTPDPRAGRVDVIDAPGASDARGLALTPAGSGDTASATMTLELPVPRGSVPAPTRSWTVTPRVIQRGGPGKGDLAIVTTPGGPPIAQWTWDDTGRGAAASSDLPAKVVDLGGDRTQAWLVVTARGGAVALDRTTLRGR